MYMGSISLEQIDVFIQLLLILTLKSIIKTLECFLQIVSKNVPTQRKVFSIRRNDVMMTVYKVKQVGIFCCFF